MNLTIDLADYLPPGHEHYRFLLEPPVPDEAKKRDRENHILKREMAEDEMTEKKKKKRKGGDARSFALHQRHWHARHKVFDPRMATLLKNMAELRRRAHDMGPNLIEFLLLLRRFGLGRAMHQLQLAGATAHLATHLDNMMQLGLMPPALVHRLEKILGTAPDAARNNRAPLHAMPPRTMLARATPQQAMPHRAASHPSVPQRPVPQRPVSHRPAGTPPAARIFQRTLSR
ncbi:MAG: hypothetical protein EBZ69_05660 [Alphaproteobacteria bacterium]|nr:hypothetical protein [Alphaproteobacteria bacterium]NDC56278.1 hypothetical protein [Alphaproteobacteria bacterium]